MHGHYFRIRLLSVSGHINYLLGIDGAHPEVGLPVLLQLFIRVIAHSSSAFLYRRMCLRTYWPIVVLLSTPVYVQKVMH